MSFLSLVGAMTVVTVVYLWAMVKLTFARVGSGESVPFGPITQTTTLVLAAMVLLEVGSGITALLEYVWFNLPL